MPRWDPRHPSQKNPNWNKLNAGQQRYAEEQWMLARIRRGLQVPEPDSNNVTVAVPSTSNQPTTSTTTPYPYEDSGGSPPTIDDFNLDLFDDNNQPPASPQPSASNALVPYMSESQLQSPVVTGGSARRPSENAAGGTVAKRQRYNDQRGGSQLPGTAGGQGSSSGGGIGGASEDMPIMEIPRPFNYKGHYTRSFHKQHKFLTFGIAPNVVFNTLSPPENGNVYFMTTGLASIPVHLPHLYLTPMEFQQLRPGERVTSVRVTVVQRNVRVAFETSASTSGLATLNQNKNGVYAIGLNQTGYGVDSTYTGYDATEPMKPTQALAATYNSAVQFYGVDNSAGAFNDTIPTHQFGIPIALTAYWTPAMCKFSQGGWPNIEQYVTSYDAADAVGQVICDYVYKPKVGLLKKDAWPRIAGTPYRGVSGTSNQNTTIPNGRSGSNTNQRLQLQNIGHPFPAPAATPVSIGNSHSDWESDDTDGNSFAYSDFIEKSQFVSKGIDPHNENHNISVQPSLHVGVEAVPKLGPPQALTSPIPTSWTDVQSYFDVSCTMHTEWFERAEFAFPQPNGDPDIAINDHYYISTGAKPNLTSSTVVGRYTTQSRLVT